MDQRTAVRNYIKRHGHGHKPERIRRALYNAAGGPVPTSMIREVLAEVSGPTKSTPPSPSPLSPTRRTAGPEGTSKIKTRTLTEFRSQHDYALKLKRTIADLGEGYLTEHEIKIASGIPNHVWRRYADLPEFQDSKLKLRDVTYWAKPRVIQEMKDIVGPI
jgi:hypothetical protein